MVKVVCALALSLVPACQGGHDVRPPAQMNVVAHSAAECADMGGHGWTSHTGICLDVDY